jgi:hypothetical protein
MTHSFESAQRQTFPSLDFAEASSASRGDLSAQASGVPVEALREESEPLSGRRKVILGFLFGYAALFPLLVVFLAFWPMRQARKNTLYAPGFSQLKFDVLEKGMSRDRVRALVGEPLRVTDFRDELLPAREFERNFNAPAQGPLTTQIVRWEWLAIARPGESHEEPKAHYRIGLAYGLDDRLAYKGWGIVRCQPKPASDKTAPTRNIP